MESRRTPVAMEQAWTSASPPAPYKTKKAAPAPAPMARDSDASGQKRRCVSTACVSCRKRKSKCDGALPGCAACSSVYGTECVYDPNSDHRRKGVYREKLDSMKAQTSTLRILMEAILNADDEDVPTIVNTIRTCDSLDRVAESMAKQAYGMRVETEENLTEMDTYCTTEMAVEGERDLARKMGELRVENGSVRFIGGTSHLIYLGDPVMPDYEPEWPRRESDVEEPITSWSEVCKDKDLIIHLMNMYFSWHYPYFATLSKNCFYRDFFRGRGGVVGQNKTAYCSSLLVNAMLALACHFTDVRGAYATAGDSGSKGDHFFAEAKRLIVERDEYEKPRLATVQALALMSVREAGCGREAKGWVYSGMSFRMAQDLGLNLDMGGTDKDRLEEQEVDARRITFWGCFLFDKCWSNYLGRLPQLARNTYNVPKYDVFPAEEAEPWAPYTDQGIDEAKQQASRTRAVGLQLSKLCEISSDLLLFFYHPKHMGRSSGKAVELKKLSELHRRLEDWRRELPAELEPKDGQLPHAILMHMFFHLQYIHLFRPFLKYAPSASPLPPHVSPRRICTANAGAMSKLSRLYKKCYNLRQICNIAVYMIHSACTIHLLNLPDKAARRDIIHGVRHLEEMAEDWLCARRTLAIFSVLARKWSVDLPEEAAVVLRRTDERWGTFSPSEVPSESQSGRPSEEPSELPCQLPSQRPSQLPSPASHLLALSHPAPDMTVPVPDMAMPWSDMMSLAPPNAHHFAHVSGFDVSSALASSAPMAPTCMHPTSLPRFSLAYVPVSSNKASSGSGSTPTTTRTGNARTASSVYAVDGQDWYLRDSVNWQSAFDGWDLTNGTGDGMLDSASAIFTFRANMIGKAGVDGGGGGGTSTLRSPQPATYDWHDLSNLADSVRDWNSLPGLE